MTPLITPEDEIFLPTCTGRRVHIAAPLPEEIDVEDIAHALSHTCRFAGHVPQFYCVTPETRVLTANVLWAPAESLRAGDPIVGFDEWPVGDHPTRKNRRARHATVIHASPIKQHCFRLRLAGGESVTSSAETPWLVTTKVSGNQHWLKTKRIAADIYDGRKRHMHRFFVPWDAASCNPGGYLAGIFDGEGHVCPDHPSGGMTVGMGQKPGVVLEETKAALRKFGFSFGVFENPQSGVMQLQIQGGWQEKIGFLGIIRPRRLLRRYQNALVSGSFTPALRGAELMEIEAADYVGEQWVIGMETSTHTYFAEGFAVHNSVAQHSVLVSELVEDRRAALWGLLHDASEAYLHDLTRPLKRAIEATPESSDRLRYLGDALAHELVDQGIVRRESWMVVANAITTAVLQDRIHRGVTYAELERRMMAAICGRFGLPPAMPAEVTAADNVVLATELRDVCHETHQHCLSWAGAEPMERRIKPLCPEVAKDLFLVRFEKLAAQVV